MGAHYWLRRRFHLKPELVTSDSEPRGRGHLRSQSLPLRRSAGSIAVSVELWIISVRQIPISLRAISVRRRIQVWIRSKMCSDGGTEQRATSTSDSVTWQVSWGRGFQSGHMHHRVILRYDDLFWSPPASCLRGPVTPSYLAAWLGGPRRVQGLIFIWAGSTLGI